MIRLHRHCLLCCAATLATSSLAVAIDPAGDSHMPPPGTRSSTTSATELSATTTHSPPDFSSPAATALTMRQAIRDRDEATLREILAPYPTAALDAAATRDPRLQLSDAQAGVILAGKRIADAIARRFGESGNRLAAGAGVLSPDVLDSALAGISDAQFRRVSDDLATLPQAGDPQARILFRRVEKSPEGREIWHVDLAGHIATTVAATRAAGTASTLPTSAADNAQSNGLLGQAAFMRRLAIALNEAAEEIEQGRRRTLDDARAAIVDRFHSTIARSIHPPTQPTTRR